MTVRSDRRRGLPPAASVRRPLRDRRPPRPESYQPPAHVVNTGHVDSWEITAETVISCYTHPRSWPAWTDAHRYELAGAAGGEP